MRGYRVPSTGFVKIKPDFFFKSDPFLSGFIEKMADKSYD
jgi:hypothetical protein